MDRPDAQSCQLLCFCSEREFLIDNLLVRVHFIIEMILWTGLTPSCASCSASAEGELFIDNLLVRVQFIIEMIWCAGLAPSLTSFSRSALKRTILCALVRASLLPLWCRPAPCTLHPSPYTQHPTI